MKREVQESRLEVASACGTTQMLDLPDDCLHHILSFLSSPSDVLNLGLADT
jgi:hypothetical protein